ncbi:MAG: DUF2283 domain-containing protein [Chloroflexi bacterium]|nr:DUF2283 domain-containing protein [Chloroflexota bacterium]
MKVIYDKDSDTLTIILREAVVEESDEEKQGIILDYDVDGNVVSLEVLDASRRVKDPSSITLEVLAAG